MKKRLTPFFSRSSEESLVRGIVDAWRNLVKLQLLEYGKWKVFGRRVIIDKIASPFPREEFSVLLLSDHGWSARVFFSSVFPWNTSFLRIRVQFRIFSLKFPFVPVHKSEITMDPFYQSLQTSRDVVAFPDAVFLYRNQRMIVKFRFENLNLN